jgi:hypothetical protein
MLLPYFEWIEAWPISAAIRDSGYMSAAVNIFHLLALVVLAGAILILDLRLLGGGLKHQSVSQVARETQPWLIGGLLGMVATGIPQLISTPIKQYYSDFFWLKMEVLVVALIFTFTVRQWVAFAGEGRVRPIWAKLVCRCAAV